MSCGEFALSCGGGWAELMNLSGRSGDIFCTCYSFFSVFSCRRILCCDWLPCELNPTLLLNQRKHTHTCRSVSQWVFSWRQCVQHLVEQLQRSVQVNLQPAGGVLDALTRVIAPPTFNEAQTHNTQPAQVVHTQTCCWTHTWRKTGSHTFTLWSDSQRKNTRVRFLKVKLSTVLKVMWQQSRWVCCQQGALQSKHSQL